MVENQSLWAVAPRVFEGQDGLRWDHSTPELHRVVVVRVGGLGEPNEGQFLVETPCGYHGWVKQLNQNRQRYATCEACLNERPCPWMKMGKDWDGRGELAQAVDFVRPFAHYSTQAREEE